VLPDLTACEYGPIGAGALGELIIWHQSKKFEQVIKKV
jgi:hypothetical protein